MPGGANHDGAGGPGSELGDVAEARLPGGAVLDLHCHSSERSLDSGVRAEVLVAQAVARGLDGVCLTEHNAIWPEADVRALGDLYGVSVIRGMEVNTQVGHVLVFGLDRYRPALSDIHRLREAVVSEGGAMVWAHPMRQGVGSPPSWKDVPGPVRGASRSSTATTRTRSTATGRRSPRSWAWAARGARTRTRYRRWGG